ncbi:hypothetical protein BGX38DRAFT_1261760 [Terfezia claveryi]|nr:hypothetical protein BGX38DRAFT_1261760 [Terfezia claveryi]
MTFVRSSIEPLLSSLLGFIRNTFDSIIELFRAFYTAASTAVTSAFDLFKAILSFLISNIFLMIIIGAGFLGYTVYLERQRGQKVGSGPGGRPLTEKGMGAKH